MYFYSLNSNKSALLLSEHQLQRPLFLRNATLCAASGPSRIVFSLLEVPPPLLSSTPSPQLITTHQVSVLMFLLPRHLLWLLSLLIAVIRIELSVEFFPISCIRQYSVHRAGAVFLGLLL